MKLRIIQILFLAVLGFAFLDILTIPVPTTIDDFFLPGSQPGESGTLESPNKCDNCHGGYDNEVEPTFNWKGSMMSQAARDPLFFACLAVAEQDAPGVGDFCIRCHSPKGWLEGRSVPTDGSALTTADMEGITCDFCHKLVAPTELGVNPYPNDAFYTENTYPADQAYLATIDSIPPHSAHGMYIADAANKKRGPFTDPDANHQFLYSPFHRSSDLCGNCHDVSNPVFSRDTIDGNVSYVPNTFGEMAPDFNTHQMFPLERTYSEWSVSAYNSDVGVLSDAFGGNLTSVASCQDCHMQDVTGQGCNKNPPIRDDLPLHDMTGGNTFIPLLVAELFPSDVDTEAIYAGIERAEYMLQNAATMSLEITPDSMSVNIHVVNETGHKLPSGYPEGRRIWIQLKAWGLGGSYFESGNYDNNSGVLTIDPEIKVYEIKPGISQSLTGVVGIPAGPTFHFVLNDTVYKDNRIPPRGFTNANFDSIQSPIVGYTYADSQYWDDTEYNLPFKVVSTTAKLYYQITSKEYVEFLKDENVTNNDGIDFYNLWVAHGKAAPEEMQKSEWGAYLWTGASGTTDWFEDGNWNLDKVPIVESRVIIPGGLLTYPIITDSVKIRSLHLETGSYMEVLMPGYLNVIE